MYTCNWKYKVLYVSYWVNGTIYSKYIYNLYRLCNN